MIFVVVKKNGVVIGKEVYGGDIEDIPNKLDDRSKKDRSLSFDIYDESSVSDFESVVVPDPLSKVKSDWEIAKAGGLNTALPFLGKKLGLE